MRAKNVVIALTVVVLIVVVSAVYVVATFTPHDVTTVLHFSNGTATKAYYYCRQFSGLGC